MKTIKLLSMLAISATLVVSCSDDDDNNNGGGSSVIDSEINGQDDFNPAKLEGNINKDITLKAGTDYVITGSLYVKEGATLTIEPGVTVKAESGGTDVFLAVEKGGKLMAEGTANKPIEFKSAAASPAAGDWGGVVIVGDAKTNKGVADTEVAGLKYGGQNDADNSGVLTYVKMSHTGAKINGDAEFNGLSLYSVGSKTKIENIYISHGSDDGIEFFGGSVNVTNLICINIADDMFDFTGGYTGTVTNAFGVREAGFTKATDDPRGIEGDSNGSDNAAKPVSTPTFDGVTILNLSTKQALKAGAEIRRGTKATIKNALFAAVEGASFGNLIDTKDDKGNGELTISGAVKFGNVGENKVGGAITGEVAESTDALSVKGDVVTVKTGLGADFTKFSWTGYTELKK